MSPPVATPKRRHTQAQVLALLAQASTAMQQGKTAAEACAALGISEATYYRWRANTPGAKRSQALERHEARDKIIAVAKELFLREGHAVGLDAVAKTANVTRQTLYNWFGNKERLFRLVVNAIYTRILDPILHVDSKRDFQTTMLEYGRQVLAVGLDPEVIALLRLTVTESHDFPDLGQILYATTSRPTPVLAAYFQSQIDSGRLRPFDTLLAAEAFIGALTSHPRYRALLGIDVEPQETREARLQLVVSTFVRGLCIAR